MIVRWNNFNAFNAKNRLAENKGGVGIDVRERIIAVHGEHGNKNTCNNLQLSLISCCNFNEDIPSIQGELWVIGIDYWWQWTNSAIWIIDDWIHRGIPDDREISSEVFIVLPRNSQGLLVITNFRDRAYLIKFHQFMPIHCIFLVQWYEPNFFWLECLIRERPFNFVQIMCTHWH